MRSNTSRWLAATLVVGLFGLLLGAESRSPLRRNVQPRLARNLRNLAMAGINAALLQIAERPLIVPLAAHAEDKRWGLLRQLNLPVWVEIPAAIVLMDYTLYMWHVLTHRVVWLWRFHKVHHVDLDLDASTALRFHFAELLLSVPWRAAQIIVIGVSPRALALWQNALFVSILFHHSNVHLPLALEQRLNRYIVTPRMHGIHHAMAGELANSNWSAGLTLWDRMHGTLRLAIAQQDITIGVPEYELADELTLSKILAMPWDNQRKALPELGLAQD